MFRRFLQFGLIGVIGFAVEAVVLTALTPMLGKYVSRLISFSCAVLATFFLNRRFVFKSGAPILRQFVSFFAAMLVGATLNLATYAALLWWQVVQQPLLALACGSLVGYVVNFLLSDRVVFNRPDPQK